MKKIVKILIIILGISKAFASNPDKQFGNDSLILKSGKYKTNLKIDINQLIHKRWWSIDPKANNFPSQSPYNFVENNPINAIDPNGKFSIQIHKDITWNSLGKTGLSLINYKNAIFRTDIINNVGVVADYIYSTNSDEHFDNKKNYTEVNYLWNQLTSNLSQINITNTDLIFGGPNASSLGNILHTVQDFYSHSNYIELYIKYYQNLNNGQLPELNSIPIYSEGIKDLNFKNNYLIKSLQTGTYALSDNLDIEKASKKAEQNGLIHHSKLNKDENINGKILFSKDGKNRINTFEAARKVAEKNTDKILNEKLNEKTD